MTQQFFCGALFALSIIVILDDHIAQWVVVITDLIYHTLMWPFYWLEEQTIKMIYRWQMKREAELILESLIEEHLSTQLDDD